MNLYNYNPWIEKYRPNDFDDIILDKNNKIILNNMILNNCLNNILFYGPPGTGKTTTTMNLIKRYQKIYNEKSNDLVIHLNASDERGIDVIRSQIQSFVNSKNLFNKGKKFVILDEVDYMTKSAQHALKSVITNCKTDICFCLICNYISRIDSSLQDIFMHFHFNSLSKEYIFNFLQSIILTENLNINTDTLMKIVNFFGSDIRSMINYLQINQHSIHNMCIIDENTYNDIIKNISKKSIRYTIKKINTLSHKYNVSNKEILKNICISIQNIIIYSKKIKDSKKIKKISSLIKYVLHDNYNETEYLINYLVSKLKGGELLSSTSK